MLEMVARNLREIITYEELKKVMEKENRRAYIGFEPSGFVHLGWLMCGEKIKDLINAGFDVTILLADWHAWINDKLGGNMDAIKTCGEYIKDAFTAMGVKKARYVYASEIIKDDNYWKLILKIAKHTSLARVRRAMDIMGRKAAEAEKDFSKFIYPVMQVADIFYLDVDAALGGMDQRHAHMLARDFADKVKMKKPVALHTHLISSLKAKGRMDVAKMSKSEPGSAIFVHDGKEEIERKIRKAYCPERDIENPVFEIASYLLIPHYGKIEIGGKEYGREELEKDFANGNIHPLDLKMAVSEYLNRMIEPIRNYFSKNPKNLERLKEYINI